MRYDGGAANPRQESNQRTHRTSARIVESPMSHASAEDCDLAGIERYAERSVLWALL